MFLLHLKYHASSQDIVFSTMEAAVAALEGLKPFLGDDYRRNDSTTHTIMSPCGPVVVVCKTIEAASVVDYVKYREMSADLRKQDEDRAIDLAARKAAATRVPAS